MLWDGEPVATRTLPPDVAVQLVRATAELGIHTNVYIGDRLFVRESGQLSQQSEAKDGVVHVERPDLDRVVAQSAQSPFKLLCIEPRGQFDALVDCLAMESSVKAAQTQSPTI